MSDVDGGPREDGAGEKAEQERSGGDYAPSVARSLAAWQKAGGLLVPVLTTLLAFLIGGLVVLITTGKNPLTTYKAIFEGSGLNWFLEVGSYELRIPFTDAYVPFPWNTNDFDSLAALNLQQTLIIWVPLVLSGLAVAFAFRCGMFNIGGQGQYLAGGITAVWIGSSLESLPSFVHIVLAILAGALMGALWAGIAGLLKALVGAHEVISTIMLNWIAVWVGVFLFGLGGPLQNDTQPAVPVSNDILGWQFRINTNDVTITSLIAFTGIAVALLGRNTAIGVMLAGLLFAALLVGTSTRNLDPEIFRPELASNLTTLIQGLVVLFVGADVLILWLLHKARLRRRAPT